MNKAAQLNHVSQPAISQAIKKLEEQIGLSLLVHGKNSIVPTPESQYLLDQIAKVFSTINDLEDWIDYLKDEVSGVIRLGVSSSIAKAFVIPILKEFEEKYPSVEFKIKVGKTQHQIELIQNNEIDLGFTVNNGELSSFKHKSLFQGEFVLVGKVSAQEKFLATENRPEVRELTKALQSTGYSLASLEIESWDLLYDMAKNGLGYAFVPDFVVQAKDKLSLMNARFKVPKFKYEVVSFAQSGKNMSKVAKLFLEHLKT